ncbi:MAG: PepSY domain-containing protein, partial [Clostridia bacterium]
MPLEGDIPVEEAEKIAWDTYRKLYQEAYDTSVPAFFRLYTVFWINDDGVQGRNRWYIQFVDPTRVTGQGSGQVLIDAKTGEVLVADVGLGGNG